MAAAASRRASSTPCLARWPVLCAKGSAMAEPCDIQHGLELLRRAVDEVDVLQAIYGDALDDDDGDAASSFRVISASQLESARLLLEGDDDAASGANIPQQRLEVELSIPIGVALGGGSDDDGGSATIRCRMPPGYPETAATVALISLDGLRRAYRDDIAKKLNERAAESASTGQEAVLDIIDYLKELVAHCADCDTANAANDTGVADPLVADEDSSEWGRRWIWVHHVTNKTRCKSIVEEARHLNLRGFLKPGYPGIVCIEGNGHKCDEYVTWIKGNKSRPGGFGRNWGHHVRGHVEPAEKLLPDEDFQELEEDLAVLARICRDCLLEDEFKEYVLQHKGT